MSSWWKSSAEKLVDAIKAEDENECRRHLKKVKAKDLNRAYGGGTPLHYAVDAQNIVICDLLLDKGADPNYHTKAKFMEDFEFDYSRLGKTPLQIARELEGDFYQKLIDLMEERSKRQIPGNPNPPEKPNPNLAEKQQKQEAVAVLRHDVHIDASAAGENVLPGAIGSSAIGASGVGGVIFEDTMIPREGERSVFSTYDNEENKHDDQEISLKEQLEEMSRTFDEDQPGAQRRFLRPHALSQAQSIHSSLPIERNRAMSEMFLSPRDEKIRELKREIRRLSHTNKALQERLIRSAEDYYPRAKIKGRALVIGNGNSGNIKAYCHRDADAIAFTLKDLGFEVKLEHDLNRAQILTASLEMAVQDYTDCEMFVMFFSGHGENGSIYGKGEEKSQSEQIEMSVIFDHFMPKSATSLSGKPKIFLWDCCRGKSSDDGSAKGLSQDDYKPPSHADFLYGFASAPEFQAYVGSEVETNSLSVWTYYLNNRLRHNNNKYHFADLLTKVQRDVCDFVAEKKEHKAQSSNHSSYLRAFVEI